MNKLSVLILIIFLAVSCKEEAVARPDQLIDESTMTDILYDMALLEAIKYQYPLAIDSNEVNTAQYIYQKYKIDSIQFAQNNLYYASHYNKYKQLFTEVESRVRIKDSILTAAIRQNKK